MNKRDNGILALLSEHGRMEVAALARQLGVSAVTMRKDLDALERRGVVRREHGFAVFGGNDDLNNRLAFHYEEKRRIAREAAKLVAPGETVMIESGSCCALLAEEIARAGTGATIISNSAFIASYIRRFEGAHVVLLGGDFQNDAQVMVGPVLRVCVQQFYVEKLFVGVDGYSDALGFMSNNHLRAQAVRDMAGQAKRVFAVTQSSKFQRTSTVPLAIPGGVFGVITDGGLENDAAQRLDRAGISVFRAP